ncbi:hypothetical protein BDP27DRAFT_1418359 [Rhodocollybia butyracea]|uniref:F-box domain-containing protein n=1 Tax=Rhodocollybia butyracea TaxID=206335 RepID=A0A9P5Q162_9AGAR|nr:hypothetical protein BDP27DRAFT_1418359 [Rhodocollybia butyracea]
MASPDPPCATWKFTNIHINLSPAELAHLDNKLWSEYGPFVVSPERAEELKEILALADNDIEMYASEVARIQEQLMVVQTKKERLETQRAKLRSLLSPMRKLSNEILLHIFKLATMHWTHISSHHLPPYNGNQLSMLRWRALALSSPSLWANISVEMPTPPPDERKPLVGFIRTVARYLERSDDSPLKLMLYIQGVPHEEMQALISSLTQHVHRWETFTYSGHYPLRRHSSWCGSHLPLLAELELDIDTSEQDDELSGFDLHCFKDAPRLCALTTTEVPTSMVPYHQLRHLKLRNSNSSLVEMLQRCPSIKSLELEGWEGYHTEYSEHYTSRNITSLAIIIEGYQGSYLELVFFTFDLPSLNTIVLDGYEGGWVSLPTETFISFISRSSCMITTFTLRSIPLSDLDLIAVLHVMPSLLHLEIEDYKWGYLHAQYTITLNLISRLIQHESTSISLVPKLHTLHLLSQCRHTGTFDDSTFVSMVESRWFRPGSDRSAEMSMMGRSCIRSVVLKFDWREVDAVVYKPLQILDREGLRVVVAGTNGIQV